MAQMTEGELQSALVSIFSITKTINELNEDLKAAGTRFGPPYDGTFLSIREDLLQRLGNLETLQQYTEFRLDTRLF